MTGKEIVKQFEGLRLKAYLCPAGIPTIGYGHTQGVSLGMTCTNEQADEWLDEDFFHAKNDVLAVVRIPLRENQLDALTSFVFNLGVRKLIQSTLLKKVNAGDFVGAGAEFDKWVFAAGKKLNGLIARRAAERTLFEKGV